ncbi:MAG: hypothetical protein ACFE9L_05405 [Candidatus Hodarchaeota archaeon]
MKSEGKLLSWVLRKTPPQTAGIKRLAIPVADHPLPLGEGPLDMLLPVTGGVSILLNQNGTSIPIRERRQNAHFLVEVWEKHGPIHKYGNNNNYKVNTAAQLKGWQCDESLINPYLIDVASVNDDVLWISRTNMSLRARGI